MTRHAPEGRQGGLVPRYGAARTIPAFEDLTTPAERTYGHYLIRVAGRGQVIRASHATASRVARSRTQYGEAELSFLDAIETPAID